MWSPNSWAKYPSLQLPKYNNLNNLTQVVNKLKTLLPLVDYSHIDYLKQQLGVVEKKQAFILQIGECAERLKDSSDYHYIHQFYYFIKEIASLIEEELNLPIIKIGRIAGQFAKPRSNLIEKDDLSVFKGEIINGFAFNAQQREANPFRMLLGYCAAKKAMKSLSQLYNREVFQTDKSSTINNNEFIYTSHEALLLPYEEALTRLVPNKGYYNLSAHMVWLGARTNHVDSPHIEYLKGINNPIGIKVYEKISPPELVKLIKVLNPQNTRGKIVLIIRLHTHNIAKFLADFNHIIKLNKLNVSYICDPMHSNTRVVNNYKIRYIQDLIDNIKEFIFTCKKNKIIPGGLHLEATFLDVTECVGGKVNSVTEKGISTNYQTMCDPRLNYKQTREVVTDILRVMQN